MRVRYTSHVRDDLSHILEYIDGRSSDGAHNVKRAIYTTIRVIGEFPNGGRRTGENAIQMLPVGRYPYLIYWIVENREAWIVHIRHAKRRAWRSKK